MKADTAKRKPTKNIMAEFVDETDSSDKELYSYSADLNDEPVSGTWEKGLEHSCNFNRLPFTVVTGSRDESKRCNKKKESNNQLDKWQK